jgi:hypothetical protein
MRTHNHNEALTHLAMPERQIPVLIDSRPEEAQGFVPSSIWSDKPMTSVKCLWPSLVEGLSNRSKQRELEKEYGAIDKAQWDQLREMLTLKDRLNAGDWSPVFNPSLDEALNPLADTLNRVSPGGWFMEKADPEKWALRSASGDVLGSLSFEIKFETPSTPAPLTKGVERRAAPQVRPGSLPAKETSALSGTIIGAFKSASLALSEAFTEGLSKTRFVVWWHDAARKFVPGLYCPDFVTALYALAIWSSGTAGGWSICQRCHKGFARKRTKQLYCKPQCQAAAGMQRLRRKQKQAGAKMSP